MSLHNWKKTAMPIKISADLRSICNTNGTVHQGMCKTHKTSVLQNPESISFNGSSFAYVPDLS